MDSPRSYRVSAFAIARANARARVLAQPEAEGWPGDVHLEQIPLVPPRLGRSFSAEVKDRAAVVEVPLTALRAIQTTVEREHVLRLVETMGAPGTRPTPPILLTRWKDGTYVIQDGHHRVYAALLLGRTRLPAKILPWPPGKKGYDDLFGRSEGRSEGRSKGRTEGRTSSSTHPSQIPTPYPDPDPARPVDRAGFQGPGPGWGRSSGTVYPTSLSPAFEASLSPERRRLLARFRKAREHSPGRPLYARFYAFMAETPVEEIASEVEAKEREAEAYEVRRKRTLRTERAEVRREARRYEGAVRLDLDLRERHAQARALRGQDVWLYHGTSSRLLPKIRKEGLCPDPPRRAYAQTTPGYVYLTVHMGTGPRQGGTAAFYAQQAVALFGGEPVVLRVSVPWDSLESDEDDADLRVGADQYRTPTCVVPRQIAEAVKLR
jgi:hypothetical protein